MKKSVYVLVLSIFVLIRSAVYADDGRFTCGSDITGFSWKTFENLVIDLAECPNSMSDPASEQDASLFFEGITVTGRTVISGRAGGMETMSVHFTGSTLNHVVMDCSNMKSCEIGLDGTVSVEKLELYLPESPDGNITVRGLGTGNDLPSFYSLGYLCEGQQEFSAYAEAADEFDFRIKDVDTFSDMGFIGETVVHVYGDSSITFDNVWLHLVMLAPGSGPDDLTINTRGLTYIDLLDSGVSFTLHNLNDRHFSGTLPECAAVASDYMRIGLMLLHSDGNLTVFMDNQYVERLAFFGNGCENSTLFLKDPQDSGITAYIEKAAVYDANAEFYSKKIPYAEFLIVSEAFTMDVFYEYFDSVKDALMTHCSAFPEMQEKPGLCWQVSVFPDASSEYWTRMESAKVWSRLSNYVNLPVQETGNPSMPYAYGFQEKNIPYFYTKAAFIDTVKYSSAYGVPENSIPSYITEKGWSSLNPTLNSDKTAGITWNGGCSYNHDMTVGGIVYRSCLEDLPFTAR